MVRNVRYTCSVAQRIPRLTSAPVLAGALVLVTALAAGPLQPLDAALQGYHAKKYTPNWAEFLDSVPNAVAGQAVCLPALLGVALYIAWKRRTWHPLAIVVAAEVAFYGGIGGMKVLLGRTAPSAGEGYFWKGGAIEHGWYGIAYPSGHAAEAVLIYGALAYLVRTYAGPDMRVRTRLNWAVALVTANALVVAYYLGYHWPTDLLGGVIAGGLMLRIIVDVDRHLATRGSVLGFRHPSAVAAHVPTSGLPAPAPRPIPALPPAPRPGIARGATAVRLHAASTRRTAHVPSSIGAPWRRPAAVPVALRGRVATRERQLQTTKR